MLNLGKLDSELLKRIVFDKIDYRRPEVLTHPGIGEDCAVIDFDPYECVLSTDPITAAVSEIGRLAVHISCNDIASNGVEPLGLLLAVLLPVGTTEEDIAIMMDQVGEASREIGVEIIGGHTEITSAVTKPVIVSTAVGRSLKGTSPVKGRAKVGDLIYMTKWAGLEGTGILAHDFPGELSGCLSPEEFHQARALLDKISVVKEGLIAGKLGTSGMHDVTEGGVLGAVWEMCQVAETGARVVKDQIPVLSVTRKICEFFNINSLRLISSGSMVILVPEDKKTEMEKAMAQEGIDFACIGQLMPRDFGIKILEGEVLSTIEPPVSDELYKVVK